MRFLRRSKPLHERLAEAGGIALDGAGAAHPPDPLRVGLPRAFDTAGIHGVPRARRWDAVGSTEAPGLRGDAVHFVALADGTLVVDEDEPDGALTPLADHVETAVPPPYRAEAVRRDGDLWAVAAKAIQVVTEAALGGEEAELTVVHGERRLVVDGKPVLGSARAFEAVGERAGRDYAVLARRLDGDLWEVEATPL